MNKQENSICLVSYYDIKLYEIVESRYIDIQKFKPKIIEINDKFLVFGMFKHYGRLNISLEKLFNKN